MGSAGLLSHFGYFVTVFLMMAGLFIVIARGNLIKKLVGLGIFQTSVYLLYIAPGKLIGGTAPIVAPEFTVYSNPLPHVLILTAIVVGAAMLNALKVSGKDIKQVKLVASGAGAAALACLGLLVKLGLPRENIWVTDLAGSSSDAMASSRS